MAIDHGFFYMNAFFVAINLVGLVLNANLYYIDIKHNNGVLDKVDIASSGASDSDSANGDKNRVLLPGSTESNGLMETNSQRSRNSH